MAVPVRLCNELNYSVSIISKETVNSLISIYPKYNSCKVCSNTFICGDTYKVFKSTSDFTLNAVHPPRKKRDVSVVKEKHLIVEITFNSKEEIKYFWQL